MDFAISSAQLSVEEGAKSQLMQVLSFNDAPTLTNPQLGYLPGCMTHTPCADAAGAPLEYSVFSTDPLATSFGQYWRYEGSTDPLLITGFALEDVDLDEACFFDSTSMGSAQPFVETPEAAYFCGTLNLNVAASIGAIALNTVDGLTFYSNQRSNLGSVGTKTATASALASITYRVETPEILAAGTSRILSSNTQYVGAPEEFVLLSLQDQGLTGYCPSRPLIHRMACTHACIHSLGRRRMRAARHAR